jgi:WD40 repeat protein
MLSASFDGSVRLWGADGRPIRTLAGPTPTTQLYDAAFSPDGAQVAAGGSGGTIWVWDIASGRLVTTIMDSANGKPATVKAVAFGRSSKELVSGNGSGAIHFWSLPDGGELRQPISYPAEINHLARSPDGRSMTVTGFDPTPIRFDLEDPARQTPFAGHSNSVSQLVFSPDGSTLASVSDDKTVPIWSAAAAQQPQVIGLPETANPYAVSFNATGTALAVTGIDGVVRLIPLRLDDLMALAAQRASRPLSDLECQKYHITDTCAP